MNHKAYSFSQSLTFRYFLVRWYSKLLHRHIHNDAISTTYIVLPQKHLPLYYTGVGVVLCNEIMLMLYVLQRGCARLAVG